MKIGVLTHSGSEDNYGQILQCFALQYYLKSLGHSPFLIKYSSDKEVSGIPDSKIKKLARFLISIISPKRRRLYEEINYYKQLDIINKKKNVRRQFQKFLTENVEIPKVYTSYEDLRKTPPRADTYIVGSDQVWNMNLHNPISSVWYLQFGLKETKRISYAASIGREIEEDEKQLFAKNISGLNHISVRENKAFDLCKKIGFKNVELVVDPTILAPFKAYEQFINKNDTINKPYVFLYYLNVLSSSEIEWDQISHFINANDLSLKSVSSSGYYPAQDIIAGITNECMTIPEWLTAIYHSEFVVSTSFHGIVFAILMHKPFVAIPLKNKFKGGNIRIQSLLESLNLESRILNNNKSLDAIFREKINWNEVEEKLSELKISSMKYLTESLK